MTKQVYRVTLDKEKPIVEEIPANFVDQFVSNRDHTSKNIAEQKLSLAGGQDDLKMTGSGRSQNVMPRSKEMKKKPSSTELLHKY